MAIISKLIEGLTNDVEHFVRVYPINPEGFAQSELDGQVASALTNAFPAEPSSYTLIDTYTTAQTIEVPEDGWFLVILHGSSGNGGNAAAINTSSVNNMYKGASGGGGGGGAGALAAERGAYVFQASPPRSRRDPQRERLGGEPSDADVP